MGSQELKNALRDAGLTPEEFAEVIQVDPKSVTRWLTGQATPYPRHRAKIARALDRAERELWPEVAEPAGQAPGMGVEVNEVIGGWAHTDAPGVPDLAQLVTDTDGDIDVFEGNRDLKPTGQFIAALIAAADAGRRVRFMTHKPTMLLAPLIGHPQIEVRLRRGRAWLLLTDHVRVGSVLLRALHVNMGNRDLVLLQVRQQGPDGLYDRLSEDFESWWNDNIVAPEEVISDNQNQIIDNVELLKHFAWDETELDNRDDNEPDDHETDEQDAHQAGDDVGEAAPRESDQSDTGAQPSEPDTPHTDNPAPGARRWPGRSR